MAEITTRSCDRWGTLQAKPCSIVVTVDGVPRAEFGRDLSEKALKEIDRALARLTNPPKTKDD